MKPAILGKKVGMTQIYNESGKICPVTVIQAGPCPVLQVMTTEKDGYEAVQLGFDEVKPGRRKKPQIGHTKKADAHPMKFIREIRSPASDQTQPGQSVTVEVFNETSFVDVIGTTKGKGFAGVMKRHGFGGQPASHGVERKHRSPGSISSHGSDLGHSGDIKKGKRMAGQMGHCRCTVRRAGLLGVDAEKNLLLVKGPVPGPNGGYVIVQRTEGT